MLGITFKENCPDIRNSKVVDLIRELQSWGIEVLVSDPWAEQNEVMQEYGIKLSPYEDLHGLDSLIVAVGHEQYRTMQPEYLKSLCSTSKPVLGDIKSLYVKQQVIDAGFVPFRL